MCRIDGPFKDRNRWRVRVVDRDTGKATSRVFETEIDAKAAILKFRREYSGPVGVPLSQALGEYELHLRAKGNRLRSIRVTIQRLTGFFRGIDNTDDLTPASADRLWATFTTTVTRLHKVPAFDTQANTLNQAGTFVAWAKDQGWMKVGDLLGKLAPNGKRKRGKPQLVGLDESRRFLAVALDRGKSGDAGAVAAATALLLGMRASEISDRTVRELDDGGRILLISEAKTQAGVRRLMVPEVLQPLLLGLAKGKDSGARLFGHDRHWVLRSVVRICRLAGLPRIGAHGLRGTHATLAVEAGMSGPLVASSLGHVSFAVTERHYAKADAVAGARVGRVLDALN